MVYKTSKTNLEKELIIFIVSIINYILIAVIASPFTIWIQGLSIVIYIKMVRFKISHPYSLILPLCYLYSYAFYIDNILEYYDNAVMVKIQFLTWTAITCLSIIIGPHENKYEMEKFHVTDSNKRMADVLFPVSSIVLLLVCGYSFVSGAQSKKELALDESPILTLGNYVIQLLAIIIIIILFYKVREKSKIIDYRIILSFFIAFVCVITLGERDVIVRIAVIVLLFYDSFYKEIKPKTLAILTLIGFLGVSMLQNVKSLALQGDTNIETMSVQFMPSEFYSAGRNMYKLFTEINEFEHGNPIADRIMYAINNLPFIDIGVEIETTTRWFNNTYYWGYVQRGGGKGFTLIGDAYLYGGIVSVIVSFVVLGLIIKWLYNESNKNIAYLVAYYLFLPAVIHNMRGDFASLLSYLLKYVLIPAMLIMMFNRVKVKINAKG